VAVDYETPEPVPRTECAERVKRFQGALRAQGADVALIQQNTDLFYLAGAVAQGVLAVPAEGEAVYFVKKPFERTKEESSLQPVVKFEKDQVGALRARGAAIPPEPAIGLELDVLPHAWVERSLRANRAAREALRDAGETLRRVRAVKSQWERRMHRQAAEILDKALGEVDEMLKEGMREIDLKAKIEHRMRTLGAQGFIPQRRFNQEPLMGHVVSGESACLFSYQDSAMGGAGISRRYSQDAGAKRIRRGEPIAIDLANAFNGYLADETRTFAIGSVPREVKDRYELTVQVLETLRKRLVPGAQGSSLFQAAEEEFDKFGLTANLGGFGEDRIAFIGHGIGIELDELPVLARGVESRLEAGQVVAVEPKLVFPGVGMVGVEDSHFMTEAGAEVFTKTKYDTLS
jgi:Xaa-Pro aminopeptidase